MYRSGQERFLVGQAAEDSTVARTGIGGPRLMVSDDSGAHVYPLTKELTKIGRGGEDYWVDVTLTSVVWRPATTTECGGLRR